ncbi:hypothetical protein [Chamaesiphon sp.]
MCTPRLCRGFSDRDSGTPPLKLALQMDVWCASLERRSLHSRSQLGVT